MARASGLTCHGGCPSATGFTCACTCFGVFHNTARIAWADSLADATRIGQHAAIGDRQRTAQAQVADRVRIARKARSAPKGRRFGNAPDRAALVEQARTCAAVDWLVEHPEARSMLHGILEALAEVALDDLDQMGPNRAPRLGHHLWCTILSALARAIDEIRQVRDRAIDWTSEAVADQLIAATERLVRACYVESDESPSTPPQAEPRDRLDPLAEALLGRLVGRVVKGALAALVPGIDVVTVVKGLRILAVFLCPAPQAHPRVWHECLLPLAKEMTGDQIAYLVDWVFGPTQLGAQRRPAR